jgi:glycosyltransferase involved in cell wall biosynthesis
MPTTDVRLHGVQGLALRALRRRLRRLDLAASARPDGYIANSRAVADRIAHFYGRPATVIHPPVDVEDFDPNAEKDPALFVWAHRLVPYKQPELVAEAFRGLPYRLVMVGVGPLEAQLRARMPPNVELRGWIGRQELARLYASASGFIHVGEEDFGITMVEALASGTPVIALNRGGARDIVRDQRDGILLDEPQLEALRAAIRTLARTTWSRPELVARSREFARDRFIARFRDYIATLET